MSSLIDSLSGLVTPDLVSSLSSHVGENAGATKSALSAALPAMLAGITKLASGDGGAQLGNLLSTPGVGAGLLNNLPSMISGGGSGLSNLLSIGSRLLSSVFGGNANSIVSSLAGVAGVRGASATSIFSLAAPLVLSFLSKTQAASGLSVSGLASMLSSQKDAIERAVPAGLSSAIGPSTVHQEHVAPVVVAEKKATNWWWLLLLAIPILFFLFSRGCNTNPPVTQTPAPAIAPAPAPASAPAAAVPEGRVYFDADKSDKWAEGGDSINAVADYLKANSAATASISGYHDPSGNLQHNLELSKARATAVRDALVAAGVNADRLTLDKPMETTGSTDVAREGRRVDITVKP